MTPRETWSHQEIKHVIEGKEQGKSDAQLSQELGRSFKSINSKVTILRKDGLLGKTPVIPKSPYPILDQAPKLEGDFVIFPDVEAPFQHSEFINRVIELAHAWGIQRAVMAGDFLHFESISAWGKGWEAADPNEKLDAILEFMEDLSKTKKEEGIKLLEKIGVIGDGGIAQELGHAKRVTKYFTEAFKEIHYIMGNHDDRLLRRMDAALSVTGLADLIQAGETWKVSDYYWCEIVTDAGLYRVSHPRASSRLTALDMAMQFQVNFMMGHSHRWQMERSRDARYWAIHMGCCVDEKRLDYVQKRDGRREQHALGAVILRGGYPWLLSEHSPWAQMASM